MRASHSSHEEGNCICLAGLQHADERISAIPSASEPETSVRAVELRYESDTGRHLLVITGTKRCMLSGTNC